MIDWNMVTALATFGAAVGSWWAATAAWEQMKLQRPRPVITIEGSWMLEGGGSAAFLLQNIGSSPAFDIDISEIEGPLLKVNPAYKEHLITERVAALPEKQSRPASQHRSVPGTIISEQAAMGFVKTAAPALQSKDANDNLILDHKLDFFVSYSTLDGRRFKTPCQIRFNLGINDLRAWIVPSSSWLGKEIH